MEARRKIEEENQKKREKEEAKAKAENDAKMQKENEEKRRQDQIHEQDKRDHDLAMRLAPEFSNGEVEPITKSPTKSQTSSTASLSGRKHDLSKWKYAELRDAINTSCDMELLEACREEFHRRLKVYDAWKAKHAEHCDKVASGTEPDDGFCKLCIGEPATVTFVPCQHKYCCPDCAYRIRECIKCGAMITRKIKDGGRDLDVHGDAKVTELLTKVKEHEDESTCQICLETKHEVVFNCGHRTCALCASTIQECPFCRTKIKNRTKFF